MLECVVSLEIGLCPIAKSVTIRVSASHPADARPEEEAVLVGLGLPLAVLVGQSGRPDGVPGRRLLAVLTPLRLPLAV